MNADASRARRGPLADAVQLARRALQEIAQDDLAGLAAQMTYYFMLAFFPLLILVIGVLDALPLEHEAASWVGRIVDGLPPEMQELVRRYLGEFAGRSASAGVFLWTLVALWAASRAIGGARRGLNGVLGGTRRRSALINRLKELGFTLAALVLVGLGYLLIFGGRALGARLAQFFGWDAAFAVAWTWLRWPVTIASLAAFLTLAYRFLPDRRVGWRAALAGALPTCVGWLALLGTFRLWLRLFDRFDLIYGSLASFFLLMVVLWLFGLVFLLGGELVDWRLRRAEKENAAPA